MPANRSALPVRYASGIDPIIRMRGITKIFQSAAGEATVLKGIDVDVLQGQFVSVVGRSGSGKSTLVNMITGIDRPSSGTVEIGGLDVLHMPESDKAVWRGKNLGIVFQFFQLLPMLTLVENIMLPMDFCNIYSPASREKRALDLLSRVGLDALAYMLPGAISGGQQQCAAVARALATDPPILIADEPTGNLDSKTADQVMQIFEELARQDKTILIVTHDRVLAQRTNRRLLITDGELVNEKLVAAFPDAPPNQLLLLSKQAVSVHLSPGQPLQDSSAQVTAIYLLTGGELRSATEDRMSTLPEAGLIDLLSGQKNLSAGEQGADLLALPREVVLSLLSATDTPSALLSNRSDQDPLSSYDLHSKQEGE